MRKLCTLLLCSLFPVCFLNAQTNFTKLYGSDSTAERGFHITTTQDEGYIITGTTFDGTDQDIFVLKTDRTGNQEWFQIIGGPNNERGLHIQQTPDGNYLLTGFTQSFGPGGQSLLLTKFNTNGDTLFTKAYGGGGSEQGIQSITTVNGNHLILGQTNSPFAQAGSKDIYLVKTNSSGDTIFTKTYGGNLNEVGKGIQSLSDTTFLIVGMSRSYGPGGEDMYLLKINLKGKVLWDKAYGGPNSEMANAVTVGSNNQIAIAGHTSSFGIGQKDGFLLTTNDTGKIEKAYTIGSSSDDIVRSILFADSGYVMSGDWKYLSGNTDMFMAQFLNGDTTWTHRYSSAQNDFNGNLTSAWEEGYVLTGQLTNLFSTNASLITTNLTGHGAGCYEKQLNATVNDVTSLVMATHTINTQVNAGGQIKSSTWPTLITPVTDSTLCPDCIPTTARFTYSKGPNRDVSFQDTSINAEAYKWKLGDGTTDTLPSFTHTYSKDSTYNVCLITSNNCDNDTTCQAITVKDSTTNQLSNISSAKEITIAPVPFTHKAMLQISPQLLQSADELHFKLYSITGKKVRHKLIRSSTTVIKRDELPKGIYIYKINTPSASHLRFHNQGKLIIQ